jgi:serine phosphatase RsbU (regulator of sigma subunit)
MLQRLQRLAALLGAADSLEAIAATVVHEIVPGVGAVGGVVALREGDALTVLRTVGYGEVGDRFATIALDAGLPLTAACLGNEPIWLTGRDELQQRFTATAEIPRVHNAWAALPITVGDTAIGALGISFEDERTFSVEERAFLMTVAHQCALAVERCRLSISERERREAAEEEAAILEAVHRTGVALVGELELRPVLQAVTDAATRLSDAKLGAFYFNATDEAGDRYEPYSMATVPRSEFEGVASCLAVPVVSRDGTIHGELVFGHPEPDVFTDRHQRLVEGLARHAAVAIDNALRYHEEQRRRATAELIAAQLERIQVLTTHLSRAMTTEEVMAALTAEVLPGLASSTLALWTLDEDERMLRLVAYEDFPGTLRDLYTDVPVDAELPISLAARTREPVLVSNPSDRDARFPVLAGREFRARAFAVLPLVVEDRVTGVLSLGFEQDRTYDELERRFFNAVAEQAALTLDRARLYDSERRSRAQAEDDRRRAQELAHVLQTSLLPPELPTIPGVDLAARYHPAMEGLDVGGDFYDVFDTGGDWAIVIGDVCGKGPGAAALTALARYTIRSAATDVRQPATVLRRLNEVLYNDDTDDRFCTVVYGRVVPTPGGLRISVSCGGHMPPLILRADGTVEPIGAPGYLIGVFPDVRLWEETAVLARGDTIVLYTDGVTEATRDRVQFGEDGLRDTLAASAGLSAMEIACKIENAALEFGGAQPRDDIALLVLRVPPLAY